jgi:outer membrane protein
MRYTVWPLAVLLLAPAWVRSETIEEAWQAALAHDWSLQAAYGRVDAADAELAGARAERLPQLSAGASWQRWDTVPAFDFGAIGVPTQLPLFDGNGWTTSAASVSVPVFTSGGVRHGIDAAAAALSSRQRRIDTLVADIKLAVAGQYIGVLRARSALEVSEANVQSLTAHTRDVEDMYTSGQVARNDYLAAAVSLADAEQRALQAATQLDIAYARYNRQLGRPLTASVELDSELPQTQSPLDVSDIDALIGLALSTRHELDEIAAAETAYRARSQSVQAGSRPQIFLTGNYWYLQNDVLNQEDFWALGLGFNWNFFDSGRKRHAAAALEGEARALGMEASQLGSMIELEVRQAALGLHEAQERLRVTEAALVQAEENLRVARDRYRNGEGTNTDVLNAETLRSLSRGNHDSARYDAALADFQLARAVGRL